MNAKGWIATVLLGFALVSIPGQAIRAQAPASGTAARWETDIRAFRRAVATALKGVAVPPSATEASNALDQGEIALQPFVGKTVVWRITFSCVDNDGTLKFREARPSDGTGPFLGGTEDFVILNVKPAPGAVGQWRRLARGSAAGCKATIKNIFLTTLWTNAGHRFIGWGPVVSLENASVAKTPPRTGTAPRDPDRPTTTQKAPLLATRTQPAGKTRVLKAELSQKARAIVLAQLRKLVAETFVGARDIPEGTLLDATVDGRRYQGKVYRRFGVSAFGRDKMSVRRFYVQTTNPWKLDHRTTIPAGAAVAYERSQCKVAESGAIDVPSKKPTTRPAPGPATPVKPGPGAKPGVGMFYTVTRRRGGFVVTIHNTSIGECTVPVDVPSGANAGIQVKVIQGHRVLIGYDRRSMSVEWDGREVPPRSGRP